MPVTVKRSFVIKQDDRTIVFTQEELAAIKYAITSSAGDQFFFTKAQLDAAGTETDVVLTCQSKKCAGRRKSREPFTLAWNEESLQKDPTTISDEFFRCIKVILNPAQPVELVFCSPGCLKDFLTYEYVAPRSPRELMEAAKSTQAQELKELNPHLIDPSKPSRFDGVGPIPEPLQTQQTDEDVRNRTVPMPAIEVAALCQADGDPGDEHVDGR